jgi:hypothetical protein
LKTLRRTQRRMVSDATNWPQMSRSCEHSDQKNSCTSLPTADFMARKAHTLLPMVAFMARKAHLGECSPHLNMKVFNAGDLSTVPLKLSLPPAPKSVDRHRCSFWWCTDSQPICTLRSLQNKLSRVHGGSSNVRVWSPVHDKLSPDGTHQGGFQIGERSSGFPTILREPTTDDTLEHWRWLPYHQILHPQETQNHPGILSIIPLKKSPYPSIEFARQVNTTHAFNITSTVIISRCTACKLMAVEWSNMEYHWFWTFWTAWPTAYTSSTGHPYEVCARPASARNTKVSAV